jgi:hypothetical protein
MPPDALSGQKMTVANAICKDGINYDQMFESIRANMWKNWKMGIINISHSYLSCSQQGTTSNWQNVQPIRALAVCYRHG